MGDLISDCHYVAQQLVKSVACSELVLVFQRHYITWLEWQLYSLS